MDANDDKNIESKLREILGYLHTLGVNIQKRTQHLLDSRINEGYLRSVKNLDKVADKVNTICNLSVTSLHKVNNGIKVIIEHEKQKVKSASKEMMKEESEDVGSVEHKSHKSKHHTTKPSRHDMVVMGDTIVPDCKRKRLTLDSEEVSLPEDVSLDFYSNCSVRLLPQDSNAISNFASSNPIVIDTELVVNDCSGKHERRKKSRIQSRPRHSHLTDHSIPDECSANDSSFGETSRLEESMDVTGESRESPGKNINNLDIKDKKGWEKKKPFKRIIHSDSSDDENNKKETMPSNYEIKSEGIKKESTDKKPIEKESKITSSDADENKKSPDKRKSDKKRSSDDGKSWQSRSSEVERSSHSRSSEGERSSHRSSELERSSHSRSSKGERSSHGRSEDRKSSHHRSSEDRRSSHSRSSSSRKSIDDKRRSDHRKSSDSKKSSGDRKSSDNRKSCNEERSSINSELSDDGQVGGEEKSGKRDVPSNEELINKKGPHGNKTSDSNEALGNEESTISSDIKSKGDCGKASDDREIVGDEELSVHRTLGDVKPSEDKEALSDRKSLHKKKSREPDESKTLSEDEKSDDNIKSSRVGETRESEVSDDTLGANHTRENGNESSNDATSERDNDNNDETREKDSDIDDETTGKDNDVDDETREKDIDDEMREKDSDIGDETREKDNDIDDETREKDIDIDDEMREKDSDIGDETREKDNDIDDETREKDIDIDDEMREKDSDIGDETREKDNDIDDETREKDNEMRERDNDNEMREKDNDIDDEMTEKDNDNEMRETDNENNDETREKDGNDRENNNNFQSENLSEHQNTDCTKAINSDGDSSHSITLEPIKKKTLKLKRKHTKVSREDQECGTKNKSNTNCTERKRSVDNEEPSDSVDESNVSDKIIPCDDKSDLVTSSSKDNTERLSEPDSLARKSTEEGIDNIGESKDNVENTTCDSPPYYPSDNEGFGDQIEQISNESSTNVTQTKHDSNEEPENKLDELKSKESVDEVSGDNAVENSDKPHMPQIRCVNINSLLSKDIQPNSLSFNHQKISLQSEKQPSRKHKNVTFLEKPIHIKNSKTFFNNNCDNPSKVIKKPTSILLNKKSKYNSSWLTNSVIELTDSDSDESNTTRELLKNIKSNILGGKSDTFVNISRDEFLSTNYTESLHNYGVKKVYNELGKLCFSEKQKKLNEDAKKSVLTSSSSDEELKSRRNQQDKQKLMVSSSNSDSESLDFAEKPRGKKKRKKKFTKKRHRKTESDSDDDINISKLLKFSKRRRKVDSSDESSDNKKNVNSSSDDEMGRSARLKQREAPTAFTQSNKDRNESDSSSSSSLSKAKTQVSKDKSNNGKECNVLLDKLVNGDVNKSASDTDQSMTDKSDTATNSKTVAKSTEKPLADKIKSDLLEDESSSSAQESIPKVNGKDKKKTETEEDIRKVLIEDSDEEQDEKVQAVDSDIEESKRPSSTINLDTDSDDSIKVTKTKIKKSAHNGNKDSDGSYEAGKEANSDSNESEIFIPSKRKRKPKKKSSSSGSDEDNSQDSETTETTKKRKRIKKMSGDESSGNEGSGSEGEGNRKGRKNIRALKKTSHLDSATREAAKKERERVARIAERQKLYNESMFDESGGPEEIAKLDKIVLDFNPKTKDPIITVDKGLVEKLKPHQANGIKFMWNACFESVKQINTSKGSGCILAHCMGLGKTLQVVTLVHTLLVHKEKTKVERVLVVCPLSTVLNWVNEFRMWLEHAESDEEINIFELSRYKQNHERSYQLKEWLEYGGVCILGYDMFRNLSADNPKKFRKAQLTSFQKSLVDPGPNLVVCDEGHLLKNEKTSLSQSMNRVKTLRRIVLTGTPLQNNLKEYYCMVQFVKPNLLGKYSEYLNRFVNPITNGQYTNSTDHDIKIMKRRSHVLHKMLDGAVQRRDYAVLAPFLPPKHEYVLFITLTEIQIKLYRHYLENYSRRPNPDRRTTPSLFSDFQSLQRIWTHPLVLKANSERYELMQQKKRDKEEEEEESEGSLADFIDDEEDTTTPEETSMSESDDSDESDRPTRKKNKKNKNTKTKHKRVTRATAVTTVKDEEEDDDVMEVKMEEPKAENPTEWWMSLCSEEELNDIRHSNKLLILLDILKECEAIGDKLLVFSQSLYSLDLIEQFLSKIDESTQRGSKDDHLGGHSGSWSQGLDYFRLDGSTSCENRAIWCKAFNREDNPRARLFLISTRAGGLGINLVAANRVVIFDMSWNPSHDVQSIFRVYRFGQKKPCYIYRFLALGTMEEKIYERQVTKQAISKRVIDEQQIDRHYTESDLAELYIFNPEPDGSREVPILPKDRLFADLLKQHDTVIYKYHEHDSLLENKEEETLTEEERKAAWEDYENEKTRPPPTFGGANWLLMQQQQQQQQMTINALQAVLRQDYPTLTEQQITAMIPAILQQMHTNGDAALTQKLGAMMAAQNNMLGGQMPGFKYNPNMLTQGMMMNPGGMGLGMRNPMYQQAWQQQQQQLQMQRLQQQQAMQANMKYYAGGLGSRDLMDMAALQQQQRALLLGSSLQPSRGRPPKTVMRPQRPINANEVVDLDSE